METTYKLEDLARAADVSPRTVRYYVQRGLLPAPSFRGRDTAYTEEHLARLRAIRKLQDQYLPLDAIAAELAHKSAEEILGAAPPQPAPPMVAPPPPQPRSWRRYEVKDGIEIHVRDDVAPTLGNLVTELARFLGQGGPYR